MKITNNITTKRKGINGKWYYTSFYKGLNLNIKYNIAGLGTNNKEQHKNNIDYLLVYEKGFITFDEMITRLKTNDN